MSKKGEGENTAKHCFGYTQNFVHLSTTTEGLVQNNAMIECQASDGVISHSACAHSAVKKVQELTVQGLCAMVSYYLFSLRLYFDLYLLATAYVQ